MLEEGIMRKGFGEDVGGVVGSLLVLKRDVAVDDLFTNKMMSDVDPLSTAAVSLGICHLDPSLVIFVHSVVAKMLSNPE